MTDSPAENSESLHSRTRWLTGAGWLTAATALNVVASAGVGIALVRSLGPSDLGLYSVAVVAASLTASVITFRLDIHLLTVIDRSPSDRRHYDLVVRCAYLLYTPLALVTVGVAATGVSRIPALVLILAAAEVGLAPLLFSRVVLQARMRQRATFAAAAISRASWAGAVVALIVAGSATVVSVLATRVLASAIEAALLSRWSGMPLLSWLWNRPPAGDQRRVLRAAVPLALAGISGEAYTRVDQPMVAAIRGRTEAGLYAAGVRLVDVVGVLAPVVQNVVSPALVDSHRRNDDEAFDDAVRDGILMMLLPCGLLVAVTIGKADYIALTLLGPEFRATGRMLAVLAVAEWITFVGTAYGVGLIARGRRSILVWANIAGLLINLAGNIAFVRRFGGLAAAWSSVAGYLVASVILMVGMANGGNAARAHRAAILRCGVATALSAIAVAEVRSVPVAVAIGSATYVAALGALLGADVARAARLVRSRLGAQDQL